MKTLIFSIFSLSLFFAQSTPIKKVTHIKDVRSIFKHGDHIWVGTKGNGLHLYRNQTWRTYSDKEIPKGVSSISITGKNKLIVAGLSGFAIYDNAWKAYTIKEDMKLSGRVLFSARLINNENWFGGVGGASKFDGNRFETISMEDGLKHQVVHDVTYYKGQYYFATRKGGLNVYDGKTWTYEFEDKNCRALMIDQQNNLWLGTSTGAYRFDGNTWTAFHESIMLIPAESDSKNGYTLFISEGKGLLIFDGKDWRLMDTSDGLTSNLIYTIEEERPGHFWVGHDQGIDMIQLK